MKKTYKFGILIPFLLFSVFLYPQTVNLSFHEDTNSLFAPSVIHFEALVDGVVQGEPAYLKVNNTEQAYRKLKFANNNSFLYGPKISVLNGGNNLLKITLRDPNENINWSEIKIRPQAIGSLTLAPYVNEVGGIGNEWKTISIPIDDFDAEIDFNAISYMEFPYSANANIFEIQISKVEFTGGSQDYLWFGDNKLDNIHDGDGAPYHMTASVIDAVPVENNVSKVEVFLNNEWDQTDEDVPFTYSLSLADTGVYSLYAKVTYEDYSWETSPVYQIHNQYMAPPTLSCSLVSPLESDDFESGDIISMEATIQGAHLNEPTYLQVTNNQSGYRKLKLGYNPDNIYGPGLNVIENGNTKLEICLRSTNGFNNWDKIKIRPQSQGSLTLKDYVNMVGGVNNEWVTLSIPLDDFSSSIDFSNLAYFEFPYSADAGNFTIDIKKMAFTGGNEDFIWFGDTKTDNKHDGYGGSGQLNAQLVANETTDETVEKVEFYVDSQMIDADLFSPFTTTCNIADTGNHILSAKAFLFNGQSNESATINLHISPLGKPVSPVQITITSPSSADSVMVNEPVNIIAQYAGIQTEDQLYLKVWTPEMGYRKLKFGYHDEYIYSGHADVISGGNTMMEIELKAFSNQIPWDKMRLRPSGKGSLTLDHYLNSYPSQWTTIAIPLNDFDSSIDFSDLSYIEFPYSANAGAFSLGIRSVKFTEGSQDFIWFDNSHYHNAHDGIGGSGKLLAEIFTPSPNPVSIIETSLFANNQLVETQQGMVQSFSYTPEVAGITEIHIQTLDSDSLTANSAIFPLQSYENDWSNFSRIDVEFSHAPQELTVQKAALRYNKQIAYSFSMDDGKCDGYDYTYQLFHGGFITDLGQSFPGMLYTDGCGNDLNFTGGLAWNSVNSSFDDIHVNTPDYITWSEAGEMISSGWNIYNHSYSHAAYGQTDYLFQVRENNNRILEKTGLKMRHFVVPSGDLNYVPVAFDEGMIAVYSNKAQFSGYPSGVDIDAPYDTYQQKIYRRFLSDDHYNIDNINEKIDQIAQNVNDNNHIWFLEFTHRVRNTTTGGSLIWGTFDYYMNHIHDTYGKNGLDNIWVAGMEDVYDYLLTRENTDLYYTIDGNTASIYLNMENIPQDLKTYALSLNIDSDADITSITPYFNTKMTFNPQSGLLNLNWASSTMKNISFTGVANTSESINSHVLISPNPVDDHYFMLHLGESYANTPLEVNIFNLMGSLVYQQHFNKVESSQKIDIMGLHSGLYTVQLIGNTGQVMSQKLYIK